MYTHLSLTLLLPPHETMVRSHMLSARAGRNPSRGRRRRNRRRKPSCTSRRTWAKRREARAAVGAVCILGARGRRRWRGSRSRCRDAPVGAPPENLSRETHDPESAVPRSEHSDVDVDRFLWGNRDLHFNCRNLHNTPPVLLNRLCLLAPCCVFEPMVSHTRFYRNP